MRILIVEDDADGANVLGKVLRKEGHTFDHAASIAEAIRCIASHHYDVALIDVNLPDGRGELLSPLCREKGTKCIAVTGEETAEGFDLLLRKPVNFADLKALLGPV